MEKAVRKFMWSQRYNVSVAFGLISVTSMIIGDYYGFMLLTIVPLLLSFTKRGAKRHLYSKIYMVMTVILMAIIFSLIR